MLAKESLFSIVCLVFVIISESISPLLSLIFFEISIVFITASPKVSKTS